MFLLFFKSLKINHYTVKKNRSRTFLKSIGNVFKIDPDHFLKRSG